MKLITLIFFIIWSILNIANLLATDYLVSTPAEIKSAMTKAQPGDTLTMKNGVWNNAEIIFQGNGTAAKPILLRVEKPGYVILTGNSILRIGGSYLVVDGLRFVGGYAGSGSVIEFRNGSGKLAHYCRLTNCAVVDYNPSSTGKDYKWVSLYGTHNRVDHCYLKGKTHLGTTLVVWFPDHPHYHLIDHNYFGYRPPLGQNGGETIRIGTSDYSMLDSYTIVENNYFEECNGETEIISNKSCENIYRYNTFFNCEGTLTLRHGNRCLVQGNFFLGNKNYEGGGVRIIGEDHRVINNYFAHVYGDGYRSALAMVNGVLNSPLNEYFQVKNALVAFNTFVDCRYPFSIGVKSDANQSLPPLNCKISNNVVVTSNKIYDQPTEPINLVWEGNIMQGSGPGIPLPAGITLMDPKLFRAVDGLWRPDSTSPVIDAAIGDYPSIVDDMDSQSRGLKKDVGADEVSSDSIIHRPLSAKDVGPAWMQFSELPVILNIKTTSGGSVTLNPAGGVYLRGTQVKLTATANIDWKFAGWEGDMNSTDNPLYITIENDMSIQARFVENKPLLYNLSVLIFSSGGKVMMEPPGGKYAPGTIVKLTALPDSGWKFIQWEGGLLSTANPDSVKMDGDRMISAKFARVSNVTNSIYPLQNYALFQNYPNPFNSSTRISFFLKDSGHTELSVYNSAGQLVAILTNQILEKGAYHFPFDAPTLTSGIYYYKLKSKDFIQIRKMTLLK